LAGSGYMGAQVLLKVIKDHVLFLLLVEGYGILRMQGMNKISLFPQICHKMEVFEVDITLFEPSNSRFLSSSTLLHSSQTKNSKL
jgi:hypothetical protein